MTPIFTPQSDAAADVASTLDRLRSSGLQSLKESTVASFRAFWFNPDVTPAQILEKLGTIAARAFEDHAATVAFLLGRGVEMDPSEYTPPVQYTTHEDGTITIP